MCDARMAGAALWGAHLDYADMRHTDLRNADLRRASTSLRKFANPPPSLTSLGTPAQARALGPRVPAVCLRLSPGQTLDPASAGTSAAGNGLPKSPRSSASGGVLRGRRRPGNGVLGALREDWTPRFRCFRCFSQELSASEASCSAETLGSVGSGEQKTAKRPAVPPLFFAVFAPKNNDNRENSINAITKLLRAVAHQSTDVEYHAGRSFVN